MKKLTTFLILIVLFIFFFVSQNLNTYAAEEADSGTPQSTSSGGQNPAPPLSGSTLCGKTMCLANEVCVQYEGDKDQHCVPADLDSTVSTTKNNLEDCWKKIGKNKGEFPPNTTCWNNISATQNNLAKFDKTCIYEPVVQYTDERTLRGGNQSFLECGNGDTGPFANFSSPNGGGDNCWVAMLVYTDVRDATLGSYGPDLNTLETKSSDYLAQNYLYNSLFGRPNNLSATNREEYRTYWRLLPAANQANLRSFTMNMAKQKLIEDINFKFTDTNAGERETSFVKLYDKLSKQIILFFHPPFIRIGCLTDYPVCPEFAKAIKDLRTPVSELVDFASKFPFPIDVNPAITFYNTISDVFNFDVDGAYSAFTPLDFGSVRDYIVKKSDSKEDELYNKVGYADKLTENGSKPSLNTVSYETLPYIGAIYQGLLSPKFGLVGTLQPQWLIDSYTNPKDSSLYDYSAGNTPQDFPEVKISAKNFFSRVQEEIAAILKNPFTWTINLVFGEKDKNFSQDNVLKNGYNDPYKDNKKDTILTQYADTKSCPLPVSYHLDSPYTANSSQDPFEGVSKDDHHQVIYLKGSDIQWNYTPDQRPIRNCAIVNGETICDPNIDCPTTAEQYSLNGICYTRKWKLTALAEGKALTVLNNPKQSDIKKAVIGSDNFSLYRTLLPDTSGSKKVTDASIDAPLAKNFISVQGGSSATAPTGNSTMLNPAEPINRINNQAQDSVHLLQNCWTMPDKLQNSPRCKLALTSSASGFCKGEAFAKIEPNPQVPSTKANNLWGEISIKLTDDVVAAYAEAEKQTGVPCEVLAGIHYEEADNNKDQDLQSGAPLSGRTLTESAIQAANDLIGKAGGPITNLKTLMKAMSWYNGGGNRNCQSTSSYNCSSVSNDRCGSTIACASATTYEEILAACTCGGSSKPNNGPQAGSCRSKCTNGFPFKFSYNFCPTKSIGYDDPYVTNWWISPEHDNMYLLYMYDCTATKPSLHSRPGSLTVAIMYYLSHK